MMREIRQRSGVTNHSSYGRENYDETLTPNDPDMRDGSDRRMDASRSGATLQRGTEAFRRGRAHESARYVRTPSEQEGRY